MSDICLEIKELILSRLDDIIALRHTKRQKADGSFVSDGDILCESLIYDFLQSKYPRALLVAEENHHNISQLGSTPLTIALDPIDGTENFVSGLKEWGVGVSVYDSGLKHLQSMILLPQLGECLISGQLPQYIESSRICGLPSYMTPELISALPYGYEFRITGCCMYNMYNVITGAFARFEHITGCYSWDLLPGLNLALEQGLHVEIDGVEYDGRFLMPGVKYKVKVYAKQN